MQDDRRGTHQVERLSGERQAFAIGEEKGNSAIVFESDAREFQLRRAEIDAEKRDVFSESFA